MRSFILALAISAIVVPAAAQDYSVELRQTVQRAENEFAIIWRPELSMAQDDHDLISNLTSEMSSFASKIGVSTTACSSNDISAEVDSLSRRLRRIITNYHDTMNSEVENYNKLGDEFQTSSDTTSSIMTYKEYSVSYLRLRMYDIVYKVIGADATLVDDIREADCIASRIVSANRDERSVKLAGSARNELRSVTDMLDLRLQKYEITIGYVADYHL